MYPKSPFSKNIYIHPNDDSIINFNVENIDSSKDMTLFIDIRTNIERISLQLYNLKVSQDCCNRNPTAECSKNETDVRKLIQSLSQLKNKLNRTARDIMDAYRPESHLKVTRK